MFNNVIYKIGFYYDGIIEMCIYMYINIVIKVLILILYYIILYVDGEKKNYSFC